jgi:hypothetical protein
LKDGDSKVTPVLYVTGKENVGKSALTSAIVCRLQARYGRGHGTLARTYITYYIFPKSSDKANEKLQDVTTALKWMSLQITQDDILYRKGNGKSLWYGRLPRLQLFALCYSVAETGI